MIYYNIDLREGVILAKILVTDDAAFMRMMLGNILTKSGYEVFEATNGLDLLKKYQDIKPDLVTLDITMPELDGLEALKRLRQTNPEAKVVMCSAMGQQAMVLEAIQNGAIDFLVKPFEPSRVLESVKKALSR